MSYRLVAQENFTVEQTVFMEKLKESINLISTQSNIILGAKDINSRHFTSTDAYANLVGLLNGKDVENRLDRDMPCKGTASFAESYIKEDGDLLQSTNINNKIITLNIHEYDDGMKALVFNKSMIKHHLSRSILGLMYDAYEIDIKNFFILIPNYAMEFGMECSIANTGDEFNIEGLKLTEYEHEICFLIIMNWNFKQIASFMDKYRPKQNARTADTIYKCRNRICEKLNMSNFSSSNFRDILIAAGLHRKLPKLFFNRLIVKTNFLID
ncbi:hypothetical protein [Janthinobacterium sp. PAMC25594]|uniref:helix-turn-helix transcriptional regulator n=1 Tax=Janthinobacterium sp. PAMC25594 TaxID=2861284 RepID=UPI001C62DD22|nr:hypothetical protein [Janthinobacterium sp. PAMC25594]QYG08891.1 hypothetical protein KY494_09170 [Janthinobacterium sp. PAMC25594]